MPAQREARQRKQAEKPRVSVREMGGTPHLSVSIGGDSDLNVSQRKPDFVDVNIEPGSEDDSQAQKGTVFLGISMGVVQWDGENSFSELDGRIQVEQLDQLISCLTLAGDRGASARILRMRTANVVGSIGPQTDIREAPTFKAPVRTIEFLDPTGALHGRIEWLADEINDDFLRELERSGAKAMKRATNKVGA